MDMSDDKEYDEGDQISKNDEERMNDDIEVFKLGKLSSEKYDDNIEKKKDERNQMYMSDDRDSDERYQISKNYE